VHSKPACRQAGIKRALRHANKKLPPSPSCSFSGALEQKMVRKHISFLAADKPEVLQALAEG
jgi:hypothetical protein